jgi:hypothetical protein
MAKLNELPIVTNGKYRNIDLKSMENEEAIIVTKKFAEVKRTEKVGSKFNPDKKWTMCQVVCTYNGEEVGFFLNQTNTGDKYIDQTVYADLYDACGGEDDRVRITCKKWFAKDKKGKDIVAVQYFFEKVE